MAERKKETIPERLPAKPAASADSRNSPGLLPHHRSGKASPEKSVDWELVCRAVEALSPRGRTGSANPGDILRAAGHLAGHYKKAGKPLPDILASLL